MDSAEIIAQLLDTISDTFRALSSWTQKNAGMRGFRAGRDEWCIDEVLEHLALANRYLLVLIEKGAKKAVRKADPGRIADALREYRLAGDRLERTGINDSFAWECPAHMVPSGAVSADEAWLELDSQRGTLIDTLADLRNGEGVLHKTGMSVNGLGRLDVYQYIYFLLMHCRRHIGQMEEIARAYAEAPASGDGA